MRWLSRGLVVASALTLCQPLASVAEAQERAPPEDDSGGEVRSWVSAPSPQLDCSVGPRATDRFRSGGSGARRCVVQYLVGMRRFSLITGPDEARNAWPPLIEAVALLSDYYLARSDRQQAFLDTGAGFTGVGATGAALSTAAGAQTVRLWGYGALVPIVLVNFNANAPTRDLYFAGHIGLQLIIDRYRRLHSRLQMLESELATALDPTVCQEVDRRLAEVEAWPAGEDKAAFLPVLTDTATACRAMIDADNQLRALARSAALLSREWPQGFVSDALRVESLMNERDNRLRTSPTQAFTTALVSPLRTVDSLLSSQNTQAALDQIETNAVLDGALVVLHQIDLPQAPSPVTTPVRYPGALGGRATITRPAPPAGQARTTPTDTEVRGLNDWLRRHLDDIERERVNLNVRTELASDLREAALQSQLAFDYTVNTRQIGVRLEPLGTTTVRVSPAEEADEPEVTGPPPMPAAPPKS